MIEFYFQSASLFFVEIFSIKFFGRKFFDKFFFGNFSQQTLASRNFQPAKFSAIKNFSSKKFRKNFLALDESHRSILLRSIRHRSITANPSSLASSACSPRVYARALRALRIRAHKEFFGRNPVTRAPPHPLSSNRFIKLLNFFLSPYIYTYLLHICVLFFYFFYYIIFFNNLIKK